MWAIFMNDTSLKSITLANTDIENCNHWWMTFSNCPKLEEVKGIDLKYDRLIGAIIVLIGVVLIYDARIITKKLFNFGDQNEASMGLKILGFIIAIIGGLIIYFNI